MRRLCRFALLVSLTACQSPLLSPDVADSFARPSADFAAANRPADPGHSLVTRFNGGVFLTSVDEAQDLVVRHYDAEDFVACGGSSPVPPSDAQLVVTPNASIYVWRTGRIPIYVYRLSEVPPGVASPELCADLATKWIYRGTHELRNHDNNLTFDPSRTDAFGWTGQGTVYDRAGQAYRYHESSLSVVDTDPFQVVRQHYALSIR